MTYIYKWARWAKNHSLEAERHPIGRKELRHVTVDYTIIFRIFLGEAFSASMGRVPFEPGGKKMRPASIDQGARDGGTA